MSLPRRTVVLVALAAGGLVLLAAGQTWEIGRAHV